jgi:hypothetical protein
MRDICPPLGLDKQVSVSVFDRGYIKKHEMKRCGVQIICFCRPQKYDPTIKME